MTDLLAPEGLATGETSVSHWLAANREHVGTQHASEVARHYSIPSTKA